MRPLLGLSSLAHCPSQRMLQLSTLRMLVPHGPGAGGPGPLAVQETLKPQGLGLLRLQHDQG